MRHRAEVSIYNSYAILNIRCAAELRLLDQHMAGPYTEERYLYDTQHSKGTGHMRKCGTFIIPNIQN